MVKEFVISGHSGATNNTFNVPYNLTLIFDANKNETCYVPNDEDSLNITIKTMKDAKKNIYHQGDIVNDYEVEFYSPFEGVSEINANGYSFFINHSTVNHPIKLSDLCEFIQRSTSDTETIIYCVFCRGSERESSMKLKYEQDFSNIDPNTLDFDLGNPNESNTNEITNENTNEKADENLDDFDFDLELFDRKGGKKHKINKKTKKTKKYNKTKKNKKRRYTRKRR